MGFLLDPNDHTVQLYSITGLTNPLYNMIIAEGVSCWDIIDSRCTRYLNFEVIEATCLRKSRLSVKVMPRYCSSETTVNGSLYICYWIPAVGVPLIALWHSADVLLAENSPPYEPRSELSAGVNLICKGLQNFLTISLK